MGRGVIGFLSDVILQDFWIFCKNFVRIFMAATFVDFVRDNF